VDNRTLYKFLLMTGPREQERMQPALVLTVVRRKPSEHQKPKVPESRLSLRVGL
jgi:hypothetical protein